MHELTLALSDDLYAQLEAKAASKGMPLERFIVEQLRAETVTHRQQDEDKRLLHEVLFSTGLLQPVNSDLIATYVITEPDDGEPKITSMRAHWEVERTLATVRKPG